MKSSLSLNGDHLASPANLANTRKNYGKTKSPRRIVRMAPRAAQRGKRPRSAHLRENVKAATACVPDLLSMEAIWRQLADGVIVINGARRIVMINATAKRLAQVDPQGMPIHLAPSIWGKMLDPGGHAIPFRYWPFSKAMRGESITQQECRLVQANGRCYDVLFSAVPLTAANGKLAGAVTTLTDITEHNRHACTLRQQAVSRERTRMAGDIHDVLCQKLNAITLQLGVAQKSFGNDYGSVLRRLKLAYDIARESLKEARQSMWTFCHDSYGDVDPASAVSHVASQIVQGTPLSLDLALQRQPRRLPSKVPFELARITQEALSNVIRHANATRVRVEIAYTLQNLRFCVQDDGQGFVQPPAGRAQTGFGLTSMQERTERLGGRVTFDSRPGRGTRVQAVIPLAAVKTETACSFRTEA